MKTEPNELDRPQRIRFRDELRSARAQVLRDAENFSSILFAVERLGQFISKEKGDLGKYRKQLSRLFDGEAREDVSRFQRAYNHVLEGRNAALHIGAAARNLAQNCVSFALLLERQLGREFSMVSDFMISNPVCAAEWQQLSAIRQAMLSSSFSYLPFCAKGKVHLISDAALVEFLRGNTGDLSSERLLMSLGDARKAGLVVSEAITATATERIRHVIKRMRPPEPVVVVAPRLTSSASLLRLISCSCAPLSLRLHARVAEVAVSPVLRSSSSLGTHHAPRCPRKC